LSAPSHLATISASPCRRLQLRSSKSTLHIRFHANQASSCCHGGHQQSLVANADEMLYNCSLFIATVKKWLDTQHSQ